MSKLTRLGRDARRFNLGVPGLVLVLAGSLMLSSCANTTNMTSVGNDLGHEMPTAIGGMPATVPERSETQPAFPAVHDMPPARNTKVMTEEEKKRLEAELAVAREQQARRAQSAAANPN
jgi:predicted small secreted protein